MNEKDLIKIGILAAQTWHIKFPPEVHFVYSPEPYLIEKIVDTDMRPNRRPTVEAARIDSDIVSFRLVRDSDGMNMWAGYSEKFNVLVICR